MTGAIFFWIHSMFASYQEEATDADNNSGKDYILDGDSSPNCARDPKVTNILLIGADSDEDKSRSDSILMISLDGRRKKFKVTSFMRDTCLQIPGYYKYKVNAAFSLGGAALTVKTLERHFRVHIDRYVVISLSVFSHIIDKLDGVDLELKDYDADYLQEKIPKFKSRGAGKYHLSGEEALMYSRIRYVGNCDYERTQRQRNVVSSIMEKLKKENIFTLLPLVQEIKHMVKTNISAEDANSCLKNFSQFLKYPKSEFRLPTDDNHHTEDVPSFGGSILVIDDMYKAQKDLLSFLYEDFVD